MNNLKEKPEKIKVDVALKFVDNDVAVLSTPSEPVTDFGESLSVLINKLAATLYFYDAIGISAIQIGIPKAVFLMKTDKDNYAVFINPELVSSSKETSVMKEGCISFPGIFVPVERPETVKVKFYTTDEKLIETELSGIYSRCFQHEYEHLQGKTFLDNMSHLKKEIVLNKLDKLKKTKKLYRDALTLSYLESLAAEKKNEKDLQEKAE